MTKYTVLLLLALAPFSGFTQGVKANVYDKFLKKQRVETEPLTFTGFTGKNKLSIGLSALGNSFFFTMKGAGWGTTTIDNGDELILLFANDSVVTLKSNSLQSFEPGVVQNTYNHQYKLSTSQLEALGNSELVSVRKYSFKSFADLKIPQENAGKLKKLSTLFISELKKANIFKTLRQISVKDIRNYIGDSVQFCSKVYKTRYFEGSTDGPTLLDVQADFSDPFVNVVILEKDREQFNGAPEKKYLNKEVCISGILSLQNNVPYLAIHSRDQIEVKSPIGLEELDLFVGDSVSVTGKVYTARFLEDTKTKPTLLNIGAPYPDQPLTLVIENEDRKNFLRPEEEYLFKTIRVAGKVVSFKGKPQIVLTSPAQLQVMSGPDPELVAQQKENTVTASLSVSENKGFAEKTPAAEMPIIPAEFPGGLKAIGEYLRDNLMNPDQLNAGEQKKVLAAFEIDKEGKCRDIKIVESAGPLYDNEVKRVLLSMPKWKPAMQNSIFIPTQVTLPVTFRGAGGEPRR